MLGPFTTDYSSLFCLSILNLSVYYILVFDTLLILCPKIKYENFMIKIYLTISVIIVTSLVVGSIVAFSMPVFADTVKCKDNSDNNCNNTVIVQKITINNNCNIINDNKDHSSHNVNVNQLQCSNQFANIYGSLINAPVFNKDFGDGSIIQDPFAPIS